MSEEGFVYLHHHCSHLPDCGADHCCAALQLAASAGEGSSSHTRSIRLGLDPRKIIPQPLLEPALEQIFPPSQESNPDVSPDDCTSEALVVAAERWGVWNASTNLSRAWSDAQQRAAAPAHRYLEKQHSVAIYVFTQAVRRPGGTLLAVAEGSEGQLSPETSSLFSNLSDGLRILRLSQRLCQTTSLSTEAPSGLNLTGQLLRFATFVLGSDGPGSGGNTCLQVHTCFGADVTHYSALKQNSQVLIPPYEVFRVAGGPSDPPPRGQVTYRLESNLDCVYDRSSGSLQTISASPANLSWVIFGIMSVVVVFLLLPFVIFKVLKK